MIFDPSISIKSRQAVEHSLLPCRHDFAPIPRSCDTFVIVDHPSNNIYNDSGDDVTTNTTIFGNNSDRPDDEIHEVVRFPRRKYDLLQDATMECQNIPIAQVEETHALIMSRPSWLWGAEMGSNEFGVCVGNEAVDTRLSHLCDDGVSRLLGMDLVRLMLERSKTAEEALNVGIALLEEYGQGGACCKDDDWCYENGFLICDVHEAYVLETAGAHFWAAERIAPGEHRNISNGLSIRVPTRVHTGLLQYCRNRGWINDSEHNDTSNKREELLAFDWKKVMNSGRCASEHLEPHGRELAGKKWLSEICHNNRHNNKSSSPSIRFKEMATILRDTESGICMRGGGFDSTGSQISILQKQQNKNSDPNNEVDGTSAVHWFTTGSDPSTNCYKPFSFNSNGDVGRDMMEIEKTLLKKAKEGIGDGSSPSATAKLWCLHKETKKDEGMLQKLRQLEKGLLSQIYDNKQKQRLPTTFSSSSPEIFLQAINQEFDILSLPLK